MHRYIRMIHTYYIHIYMHTYVLHTFYIIHAHSISFTSPNSKFCKLLSGVVIKISLTLVLFMKCLAMIDFTSSS